MKRCKHLFEELISFDNLLLAAEKAQNGKRSKPNVVQFMFNMEKELFRIQEELRTQRYRPGAYNAFYILEPKKRLVSAAPFKDRVIHHALCNIIEPIFERCFIYDTYANRKGKGTHQAILRYHEYARQYPYVLKCDIRKFFPSIDHELLKAELRRKIACKKTLWLIDAIIDASNPQEEHIAYFAGDDLFTPYQRRRGLPIGNLTSQFWGNVFMSRFDHFVKEQLKAPGYIRYVDDFVLFAESKAQLKEWKVAIDGYLDKFRLMLHPRKTQIYTTQSGVPFLGFRVFPYHRTVKKESVRRYTRNLRRKLRLRSQGLLSAQELENGLNSWLGHVRFGCSRRLEYRIYWYLCDKGVGLYTHPRGSWRVLEQ